MSLDSQSRRTQDTDRLLPGDWLELKWGTLKACGLRSEAGMAALRKFEESGTVSLSAMTQHNTDEQKEALCELIDAVECEKVFLSWDAEYVSKSKAKEYVRNYGR